jgi:hypothetical protein
LSAGPLRAMTRVLFGLLATTVGLAGNIAWGQRVQFPTPVASPDAPAQFVPNTSPPPPAFTTPPSTPPPILSTPVQPGGGFDPYAVPGGYPQAPTAPVSPYAPPPAPGAGAPYYSPQPPALYPDGGPVLFPQGSPSPGSTWQEAIRLLQEVRLQHTWLNRSGSRGLGVNDSEVSATFAVPFFYNQSPLLVTPGFALHLWDGPTTEPPSFADLPPQTYDAFLDVGWNPQVTPWFGAELGARVGVYTDFSHTNTDSIRVLGRGLGVLTFTPNLQFKLGVVYLDRLDVKLLPAGGIFWTPNPDARYEIFFPRPKLAQRITTIGNSNIWGYVSGEYGGGSWTIRRIAGNDQFDYNDLRVMLGIEALPETLSGWHAYFEVGYVFNRELIYRNLPPPEFDLNDTFMLRAGVTF